MRCNYTQFSLRVREKLEKAGWECFGGGKWKAAEDRGAAYFQNSTKVLFVNGENRVVDAKIHLTPACFASLGKPTVSFASCPSPSFRYACANKFALARGKTWFHEYSQKRS
jgi:hypothetical protein